MTQEDVTQLERREFKQPHKTKMNKSIKNEIYFILDNQNWCLYF